MNVNTVPRTLAVAALVAFVCSAMVASAVYVLRPVQNAYAQFERNRAILAAAGRLPVGGLADREVIARFLELEAHVINVADGAYISDLDGRTFNHWETENDPAASHAIVPVYFVIEDGALERIVLPVNGSGMWSTIYGYVALNADLTTISNIEIFRHGETPGVGDRIEDPAWLATWRGKRIYDENGELRLHVVTNARTHYEVDLISGASVTSEAVGDLVRHWFGDDGYRPFLERMRERDGS